MWPIVFGVIGTILAIVSFVYNVRKRRADDRRKQDAKYLGLAKAQLEGDSKKPPVWLINGWDHLGQDLYELVLDRIRDRYLPAGKRAELRKANNRERQAIHIVYKAFGVVRDNPPDGVTTSWEKLEAALREEVRCQISIFMESEDSRRRPQWSELLTRALRRFSGRS